jgi:Protein of unknown function (DUF4236)
MGWGYRKRIKLLPGLDVNLSKRGAGLSAGRRGARASVNSRGRRSVSLGWTGRFWRRKL